MGESVGDKAGEGRREIAEAGSSYRRPRENGAQNEGASGEVWRREVSLSSVGVRRRRKDEERRARTSEERPPLVRHHAVERERYRDHPNQSHGKYLHSNTIAARQRQYEQHRSMLSVFLVGVRVAADSEERGRERASEAGTSRRCSRNSSRGARERWTATKAKAEGRWWWYEFKMHFRLRSPFSRLSHGQTKSRQQKNDALGGIFLSIIRTDGPELSIFAHISPDGILTGNEGLEWWTSSGLGQR
ncbi:hypothetical protein R3P38DRAFT_2773718 [Favolaschia claudopus]|uniref:Uncharacterized protein n=1 Tax=Favolaschia claudopus TaxID=2862362 RepID=A0AAW0C275_9AGAR